MLILITLILASTLACSKEVPYMIGKNNDSELAATANGPDLKNIIGAIDGDFFSATYQIKVEGSFGLDICDSDIKEAISSKLGTDGNPIIILDQPVIECMFGIKLDLVKVLAGLGASSSIIGPRGDGNGPPIELPPLPTDLSGLAEKIKKIATVKADNATVFYDTLMDTRYSPSRPFYRISLQVMNLYYLPMM